MGCPKAGTRSIPETQRGNRGKGLALHSDDSKKPLPHPASCTIFQNLPGLKCYVPVYGRTKRHQDPPKFLRVRSNKAIPRPVLILVLPPTVYEKSFIEPGCLEHILFVTENIGKTGLRRFLVFSILQSLEISEQRRHNPLQINTPICIPILLLLYEINVSKETEV